VVEEARLSSRFPLHRFRHAPRASDSSGFMPFETDSKCPEIA